MTTTVVIDWIAIFKTIGLVIALLACRSWGYKQGWKDAVGKIERRKEWKRC